MSIEGDITMGKRRLELAVAGLFSFALIGLTVAVTTLAPAMMAAQKSWRLLSP